MSLTLRGPSVAPVLTGLRQRVPRIPPAPVSKMFTADTTLGVWTVGGSAAAVNLNATLSSVTYTGDVLFGSKSIRVVSNGNGGGATVFPLITLTTPYDATNDDIRLWFKLAAADTLQSINVDVRDSGSVSRSANYYPIGGITDLSGFAVQTGRVNIIDLPMAALGGSGNLADTKTVRVTMTDGTGKPLDVIVYGLAFVKRAHTNLFPTGVFSITADDSLGSQWSVLRPALDNYGWRATLFPIIDQIGAPGNLTMAQVVSLHDDYGWEIAAHATTGVIHAQGLPNLTHDQRMVELEAIKKWQDANGFDSPCFAYPLGSHNAAVERDVAQFFSVGRQALDQHIGPQYPRNSYALQSINAGTQGASLSTRLTQLAAGKGMESIVYHAIKETGLTGNDVTSATLNTQLAAIASAGVTVLPMGDVVRTLAA